MQRYFIRFLALFCLAPLVFAGSFPTFTVVSPSERINGDAATPDDVLRYNIACGLEENGPFDFYRTSISADGNREQSFQSRTEFPEGTYYCVANAVDQSGVRSELTEAVAFTVEPGEVTEVRLGAPQLSIAF